MNDNHPTTKVLSAIESITGKAAKSDSNGWTTHCPAHEDANPSLSIGQGDDGKVLLCCHSGCTADAILDAIGLTAADLFVPKLRTNGKAPRANLAEFKVPPRPKPKKTATVYPTANAATAAAERIIGRPAASSYFYQDAESDHVGTILRWDKPDGTKDTIRPISRKGDGWIIGAMPRPRPLYRLPGVVSATGTICIVEGEKCSDAAFGIGLVSTTSVGGCEAAALTDWTPLAGRGVVLLPDNDKPGRAYANDVAAILTALSPPATVRIVELPDLPDHGDVVEYIEAHDTGDAKCKIEALVADVVVVTPADLPEPDAIAPYAPFPTDALPEPLQAYVHELADAVGVDDAYVALPLLSALASAIGSTYRLQLKPGYSEPSILWMAIVGPSGTMKSPVLAEVMRPVKRRQNEAYDRYEKAMAIFTPKLQVWERKFAIWKRKGGAAGEPPTKPERPVWDRCWVSDITIEKVSPMLQDQPRGLLVIRDELSGWLGSFDRYKSNGGGDEPHWLEMYGGLSTIIDRKTSGTIRVPYAHICIVGGIQPGPLRRALSAEHRENGLASRLFLACPLSRVAPWSERHPSDETLDAIGDVFKRLYKLEHDTDEHGKPAPYLLHLTDDAKKLWIDYHDRNSAEQPGLPDDLRAVWSKLKGGAARLALVVHHTRWANGDPTQKSPAKVDAASMASGIELADWFKNEAKRVYAIMANDDVDGMAGPPVELVHIVKLGGSVSIRDWQRHRSHPTSGDAEAELSELVTAGYGRWETPPQTGRGGPRSKLFVVN